MFAAKQSSVKTPAKNIRKKEVPVERNQNVETIDTSRISHLYSAE